MVKCTTCDYFWNGICNAGKTPSDRWAEEITCSDYEEVNPERREEANKKTQERVTVDESAVVDAMFSVPPSVNAQAQEARERYLRHIEERYIDSALYNTGYLNNYLLRPEVRYEQFRGRVDIPGRDVEYIVETRLPPFVLTPSRAIEFRWFNTVMNNIKDKLINVRRRMSVNIEAMVLNIEVHNRMSYIYGEYMRWIAPDYEFGTSPVSQIFNVTVIESRSVAENYIGLVTIADTI